MRVPFRKMHGLGNDFVVFDARARPLPLAPAAIARLGDRHRGIGFDQLVIIEPAEDADVFLRFHNPDGGEAGACGNGTRCAARLLMEESGRSRLSLRTRAGLLSAERLADGTVRVDMGPPRLGWAEVPLARAMDTLHVPVGGFDAACCSLGNPHATVFVDDLDGLDVAGLGPVLEHDPIFPERANIGFAERLSAAHLRLVVWERGAGLTLACGSGACAAAVNAVRRGLAARAMTVTMPGGDLSLEWREADGHVLLAGPAETAFTGEIELAPADPGNAAGAEP